MLYFLRQIGIALTGRPIASAGVLGAELAQARAGDRHDDGDGRFVMLINVMPNLRRRRAPAHGRDEQRKSMTETDSLFLFKS